MIKKQQKRYRRHKRVIAKIKGKTSVPRLYVFRSNKHIYAQIIDDEKGKTILSLNDHKLKSLDKKGKIAIAQNVGKLIAEKAIKEKISKVVFDRGGYKYHGRVKALAEGAREGGLKF
ncbi:MAG TPA: 50S ribosomal protein L18 [bacterium]|nr:50S ribosomal protein L18 [bacterium]